MLTGMSRSRSYTDSDLQAAVVASRSWSEVVVAVGMAGGSASGRLQQRAAELGLDTSHFSARSTRGDAAAAVDLPFKGGSSLRTPGHLGLSTAIHWFLSHGYVVSIPIETAPYDLIAESDAGLQRVQVKTTSTFASSGRHRVKLTRAAWAPDVALNSRGRYRMVAYGEGLIDYFFIAAKGGPNYLIPWSVVRGLKEIALEVKYASFILPELSGRFPVRVREEALMAGCSVGRGRRALNAD